MRTNKEAAPGTDIIRETYSLCPVCLKKVRAGLAARGNEVFLDKSCPDHGDFSTVVWKNHYDLLSWYGDVMPINESERVNCPADCGICREHKNSTCCVLLEVTSRCNLTCSYCFADNKHGADPSVEELCAQMNMFVVPGETLVQLSGGEPTLRDDLPAVVRAAKELGCRYVQLNSNGIRLAEDARYVKALADAGLSFVFMQFDGTSDDIYEKLRGRPLFDIKKQALANCAEFNIGVTLVPTLVPGVNIGEIGNILRFGAANSPAVRGVHFQPVTYIGRLPAREKAPERFTLDELLWQIEAQSGGLIKAENILPSACDHPMCGFHGDFIVTEERKLYPLSRKRTDAPKCCCGISDTPAKKNREFVARRWRRENNPISCCGGEAAASSGRDLSDMDYFLERVTSHGFTVTAMAFQDAGNLDLERLRMCSLHVFKDGRLIPFCANYLTGMC